MSTKHTKKKPVTDITQTKEYRKFLKELEEDTSVEYDNLEWRFHLPPNRGKLLPGIQKHFEAKGYSVEFWEDDGTGPEEMMPRKGDWWLHIRHPNQARKSWETYYG